MVLEIIRPNSTGNNVIACGHYLPEAPAIERVFMFGVKTGTIEKKTNQAMICPTIMVLFLYIKEL